MKKGYSKRSIRCLVATILPSLFSLCVCLCFPHVQCYTLIGGLGEGSLQDFSIWEWETAQ